MSENPQSSSQLTGDHPVIKVRSRKQSAVLALAIAVGVALFVALIFAATLTIIHHDQTQAQQTRRDAVIASCREQNARNHKTVNFFNGYVAHYEKTHTLSPQRKLQIKSSVQSDLTLINDLAPYENCIKRARKLYP